MRFLVTIFLLFIPLMAEAFEPAGWQGEYNVNAFNEIIGKPLELYAYTYAGRFYYGNVIRSRYVRITIHQSQISLSVGRWIGDSYEKDNYGFSGTTMLIRTPKGLVKLIGRHSSRQRYNQFKSARRYNQFKSATDLSKISPRQRYYQYKKKSQVTHKNDQKKSRILLDKTTFILKGQEKKRFIELLKTCKEKLQASIPKDSVSGWNTVFYIDCRGFNRLWKETGWK